MFDIAISGNNICTADGIKKAVVLIRDGIIIDIRDSLPDRSNYDLFYIDDKVLMPGVIDLHVAIDTPDDFAASTQAAAAGGVTTIVKTPMNNLYAKAAARRTLAVNCGFWGAIETGNENEVERLIAEGVLGFAIRVNNLDNDALRRCMPVIAEHKLPLLVYYALSESETQEAIVTVIRLCAEFNCRVHIVQLPSAATSQQLQQAKEQGLPITVETIYDHLYFEDKPLLQTAEHYPSAPEKTHHEQLWEALQRGLIDFPTPDQSTANILKYSLPILWTAARRRYIHWSQMMQWLCEKPAQLTGLRKRKGKIATGFDADLIVWDPHKSFTVTSGITEQAPAPYIGETLYGVVEQTWVSGQLAYDYGRLIEPGKGRIVTR